MTFGLSAGAIGLIGAGAAVAGGVIASSGAKSAANTQAEAANRATDAQTGMFDKTVGLEAPFRQSGLDAQSKLNTLLGIGSPVASGGNLVQMPDGSQVPFDEQSYLAANSDVAKYIAQHPGMTGLQHYQQFGQKEGRLLAPAGAGTMESDTDIWRRLAGQYTDANGNVNSDALNPAVWAEAAREKQAGGASPSIGPRADTSQAGGSFGSLLKPFGMEDFQLDPGIQFQTQQGNLALQNSQAAKDGVMSGAALKDLIGYNQGMAGTGYQSAFDRYMAGKSFTLGSLSDTASRGQAAAGSTVNAAPSFSSGIAGTITGAGNAQAAGTVGSANALAGSLSSGGNMLFLRSLLSKGGGGSSAGSGTNMSIEPDAIQTEFA